LRKSPLAEANVPEKQSFWTKLVQFLGKELVVLETGLNDPACMVQWEDMFGAYPMQQNPATGAKSAGERQSTAHEVLPFVLSPRFALSSVQSGTFKFFVATPEDNVSAEAFAFTPARSESWRFWLALSATWAIAAAATIWFMEGRNSFARRPTEFPQQAAVNASALGLQVDLHGRLLEILWNRDSVAAVHSQEGYMMIRDGNRVRPVSLDPAEIRSGHLYYRPRNADLGIRLEVVAKDGETSAESIQIVGTNRKRNSVPGVLKVPGLSE
jgi:hypothetical protein